MPTQLTRKKLREAKFFLGELSNRDGDTRLDKKEEFGYFVSAFLSAANSVQNLLNIENFGALKPQRKAWLASLDDDVQAIVNFMFNERRRAVHRGRDAARQVVQHVPVRRAMAMSGAAQFSTVITPWAGAQGATIGVATYTLDVGGRQLPATDVCTRYLVALEQLVARFEV